MAHYEQDETGQWWYCFGNQGRRYKAEERFCEHCSNPFIINRNCPTRFCSPECAHTATACAGPNNGNWNGGRYIHGPSGYVFILNPNHPHADANGYVREHRLMMEQTLGRYLEPIERVHHIDGDRQNNQPKNLRLISHSDHTALHHAQGDLSMPPPWPKGKSRSKHR